MSDAELSAKAARVIGRPFPKGVSGCPGGRPRQDVTALARAHTVDAIEALVAALRRPKEAVPAAIALLNRGWGLPKATVETDPTNPVLLHLLAATSVSAQLMAARGEQRTIAGHAESGDGQANGKIVDLSSAPPTE